VTVSAVQRLGTIPATVPHLRESMSTPYAPDRQRPHARERRSSREPFFDNAKMLLVTLVVVGHSWTLLPDVSTSSPLYVFLYTFHVPAFVLVTGFLSRGFTYTRANIHRLVTTVVVPYLVFETLLALFRVVVGLENLGMLYLSPHWPLWYLTVLFLWRLATPLLNRLRHPLLVAVVVCLLGGLNTVDELDLPRAMGLLPFFVVGLVMTREQFDRLARPRVRVAAVVLMALAFAGAMVTAGHFSKEWLYWRTGYSDLGVPFWWGVSGRLGMLVVAGTLTLCALSLIPRSQRWFTGLGSASLVVYLFHGFAVKGAEYAGVGPWSEGVPVTAFLAVTAAAVGVSVLLAATPVSRRLNTLVDPISTLDLELPGVVDPAHHRRQTIGSLALAPRDPTRLG
jgi:fucose 4-O-acetylase-like acetyltransferase